MAPGTADSPEVPLLPDLVVESIEIVPARPTLGQDVTVLVTIANVGARDVEAGNNFYADLYVDPSVLPIQLGQDGVAEWGCQAGWVPAGGSWILSVSLPGFDSVKNYTLYAQVDTDGHVAEANENNNVFGPFNVEVTSRDKVTDRSHQDFQEGLASGLDMSHPDGVLRRGLWDAWNTEPEVYWPDTMINEITGTLSGGDMLPTSVNQVKPKLIGDGTGRLFAIWEDGRWGGVFNTDIYFSRSDDDGATWGPDVRVNDDPLSETWKQVSPDIAWDASRNRLYAVWQDGRGGDFDIYFAYSDDFGSTWSANISLNDDIGSANQLNPSVVVGPSAVGGADRVYVVWQDQRNLNDDVYLVRSDNGGLTWDYNYFVTDDPQMTLQNQVAPSVGVDGLGVVFVCWEDWRDSAHPEIYTVLSFDEGETFGLDVPVTLPGGQSYRVEPTMIVSTTRETVEEVDPVTEMTYTVEVAVTAAHVAWQEGQGDAADIYWAFGLLEFGPDGYDLEGCPYPYDFCFSGSTQLSGFVIDSEYAMPPDPGPSWPVDPSWQGQVSLVQASANDWTYCHANSELTYTKGIFVVWSDAQSYDDWRYELHSRRIASPEGSPRAFEPCEDQATGVVNDNAKLYAYRNDLDVYQDYRPAATRQLNPSVYAYPPPAPTFLPRLYVAWDDDRWDKPFEVGTVRNRDIYMTKIGYTYDEAIYISDPIDSRKEANWLVLSWWGVTEHFGDLLLQTRFGTTPYPPRANVEKNGWTKWTGNPSSGYLGCTAGEDCFYDAPGRHIVAPDGHDWFECPGANCPPTYRYIQYKVIIRGFSRLTALSEVTIHYEGPFLLYLPIVIRTN
jgi:hypothetical protein